MARIPSSSEYLYLTTLVLIFLVSLTLLVMYVFGDGQRSPSDKCFDVGGCSGCYASAKHTAAEFSAEKALEPERSQR